MEPTKRKELGTPKSQLMRPATPGRHKSIMIHKDSNENLHNPEEDLFSLAFNYVETSFVQLMKETATVNVTNKGVHDQQYPSFINTTRNYLDSFFQCSNLGSSVETEIFAGMINFFSCLFVLPVIPAQLASAGYIRENSFAAVCILVGLGSIVSGLVTNLPLIIAPSTAVTVYVVGALRNGNMDAAGGNWTVTVAGVALTLIGIFSSIGRFIIQLIPPCLQTSTTVGIGLLTSLAGASEAGLVQKGQYTLLQLGPLTNEALITFSGLLVLSMAVVRHSKVSYLIGLIWGTAITWISEQSWPIQCATSPLVKTNEYPDVVSQNTVGLMIALIFLEILIVYGLARALCDMAHITPIDGVIPRGRFLILIIGLCNVVSGYIYGPPIVISPETAGGIKSGARTGLSAIVCGICFLFSIFFGPLFAAIPATGTSPLLLMIGFLLFLNVLKVNFSQPKHGIPAFCCLFFISFTNSIITGVGLGYIIYIALSIFTLDFFKDARIMYEYYFPFEETVETKENNDIESEIPKSIELLQTQHFDCGENTDPKLDLNNCDGDPDDHFIDDGSVLEKGQIMDVEANEHNYVGVQPVPGEMIRKRQSLRVILRNVASSFREINSEVNIEEIEIL